MSRIAKLYRRLSFRFASANVQLEEAIRLWLAKDETEAVRLGRLAARTSSDAKLFVAQCLLDNTTSTADASEAISLLADAHKAGSLDAVYMLAGCHFRGEGVRRNPERAVQLLREAADSGHVRSQIDLVELLTQGKDVAQDLPLALKYAELAARNGHPEILAALS